MIDVPPLVLLGLMAALIAVPVLLRRRRAHTPDGLWVVARTALSKQAVLAVVAVGERRLLVGAGDQGIRLLADLDAQPTPDAHSHSPGADGTAAEAAITGTFTTMTLDRMDAVGTATGQHDSALDADVVAPPSGPTTEYGPGNGLVDRLRARTVRTPTSGRPFHDLLRR